MRHSARCIESNIKRLNLPGPRLSAAKSGTAAGHGLHKLESYPRRCVDGNPRATELPSALAQNMAAIFEWRHPMARS
jgi:hypothetical protein